MNKWLITYQWSCSGSGYSDTFVTENELIEIHPVEWLREKKQTAVDAQDEFISAAAQGKDMNDMHHLDAVASTKWKLLWAIPVSDEIFGDGRLLRQDSDDT